MEENDDRMVRGLKEAGHSRTELAFSLLFDELGVPLVRLRPPSAQCTTMYIVLSDCRWIKGFAEYLAIFSCREASSVVQSQLAKHGKLEPRHCQTPWPSGPESDDCELASESISKLWADIFNSRYF